MSKDRIQLSDHFTTGRLLRFAILRDEQPFYFHMILNFVCMKKSENLLA